MLLSETISYHNLTGFYYKIKLVLLYGYFVDKLNRYQKYKTIFSLSIIIKLQK